MPRAGIYRHYGWGARGWDGGEPYKKLPQEETLEQNDGGIRGKYSQWNWEYPRGICTQWCAESWHPWVAWSLRGGWICSPKISKNCAMVNLGNRMIREPRGSLANGIENIQEEHVPNDVRRGYVHRWHGQWEGGWNVSPKHERIAPGGKFGAER